MRTKALVQTKFGCHQKSVRPNVHDTVAASSFTPVPVPAPTLTGGATPTGSWDFNNPAGYSVTGGSYDSVSGVDGTSITLSSSGGSRPTQEIRANKYVGRFTMASSQFLQNNGLSLAPGGTLVAIVDLATTVVMGIINKSTNAAASGTNRDDIFMNTGSIFARKAGASATDVSVVAGTGLHLVIYRATPAGTDVSIAIDGAVPTTNAAAVADGATQASFNLGVRRISSGNLQFMDGWMYRALYYTQALTDANLEEIAVWSVLNYGTPNL